MEASSTSRESMFSAEASRSCARTSPTPAGAQGSTEPGRVFGPSSLESLATFDPATSSWRTSQLCLDGDSDVFSGTWPRSGSMRSGTVYPQAPLAPLTGGTGSGLWPTPRVSMAKGPSAKELEEGDPNCRLETAVVARPRWPTPTAHPRTHTPRQVDHGRQLANEVGGSLNPTWVEWLLGFPTGWTALEPSGTPSSRRLPSGSGNGS